jgi:hypothetical protein
MKKKMKKYIKILAWISIIFSSYFIISSTIGFILLYFELMPIPDYKLKINFFTYILGLISPILLLLSGYILMKSKKKIKYKSHLAWASTAFGIYELINSILILITPFEYSKSVFVISLLYIITKNIILLIDGLYLREI